MEQNPFAHLGDAVYGILYQSIIRLEIPAEAMLSETALSAELSISRTPVRNALMRLQEDGLLVQSKGKAFKAAPLEQSECRQLMEARLGVEGQAAFWAAERISTDQLKKLEELVDAYAEACSNWDVDRIIESDHSFHQTIVDAAQNYFLSDMYSRISPRALHYRYFLFRQAGRETLEPVMDVSIRHHRAVLNAINLGFNETAKRQIERDASGMIDIISIW